MKNLTVALVLFSFLAGTLLTILGLAHLSWPQALPWAGGDALFRFLAFLIICTGIVVAGAYKSKKSPLLVGAIIAVGLALLAGALWPLLVVLWFAVASALLGGFILAQLRIKNEEDNWLTNFLVGAGIYGTAVGLLAHFPLNYQGVYGLVLALPVLLGWRVAVSQGRSFLALFLNRDVAGFKVSSLDVAIAAVALVYFIVALMPELGFDALWMHLFVPAHMSIRHQWGFDAGTYVWAVIPMLGDWTFSIGYILEGETTSRMINVGFIFILACLVRDLVMWAGGNKVGARWAVLIFLSSPLTFTEGSTLFIESIWSAFFVAGMLAVLRFASSERGAEYNLLLAGLLMGFAASSKAITLTLMPIPLVLLAWEYRTWLNLVGLRRLFAGFALFLAIGMIPYVTAWWMTGNPVFPFFNGLFKSPYFPAVNFDSASIFGKGVPWDVLYRATFESGKFLEAVAGASGFQWLLLFVPAILMFAANRQSRGGALIFVGSSTVFLVFHSVSYLRYVFPAWAILAAAMGLAVNNKCMESAYIKYAWGVMAVATVILNVLFLNAGSFYHNFPLNSIRDQSSREQYLSQRLPIRNAVELVNSLNATGTPVAVFSAPLTAGLSADALYANWTNTSFEREIDQVRSEQDVATILLRRSVEYVILDSNGWKKGDVTKVKLINKVTEQVAAYGSISVRKINQSYVYKKELLTNPDFSSLNGWSLSQGAVYDSEANTILASVSEPAFQLVVISPKGRYLAAVVARCAKKPTLGRIQINWLNADYKFISADIKTFECASTWTEHTMEVTAPTGAVNAASYLSGHSVVPLEFQRASLRQ